MKINIVSSDERYKIVSEMLSAKGYKVRLCSPSDAEGGDVLLLSVRSELATNELVNILTKINKETVVLCGGDNRIRGLFCGKIIDYSGDVDFLQKNAILTAEATVSFLHSITKDSLCGKKIFVSGYGKIGRHICAVLKVLGADVTAYARREPVCVQMKEDGINFAQMNECTNANMIINTVPSHIFTNELIDFIPQSTLIVDLASPPYGFESMDRVIIASGLPGKILPVGAAQAVYDTVCSIISRIESGA